ncbi:hypothetical protein [Hoyosella altamirensis]|uniref:Uncharacterized protein n=1 Tax=Hoyosella altamirensis TaxID=616997 RepID=A0A839RT52_9ACTN|nr:hypothetical protein [Hoyosella altamirensis]MBB3039398.1 hypothetical protein [Hoyosella altamirensis]
MEDFATFAGALADLGAFFGGLGDFQGGSADLIGGFEEGGLADGGGAWGFIGSVDYFGGNGSIS